MSQEIVWNCLVGQDQPRHIKEIVELTGLRRSQVNSALSMLNRNGYLIKEGSGHSCRWRIVSDTVPKFRNSPATATPASDLPHVQRFRVAMDALMEAFVALQPYIVSAEDKEALGRLKVVAQAMYRNKG